MLCSPCCSASAKTGSHGVRQLARLAAFAHTRANGVNHIPRLEIAPACDDGVPHIAVPNRQSILLNRRSTLAADRSATPAPRISCELAALTIASVSRSVMSPCTSSIDDLVEHGLHGALLSSNQLHVLYTIIALSVRASAVQPLQQRQ